MNKPVNYCITGGAGFIGSHLCELFLNSGHTVRVIDDLSTGRRSNIEHLLEHPGFHFARASVLDSLVMDRIASQSDVIIHLAAAVGVKLIMEKPVQTLETNILGSEAVLKAALRYGCRTLLCSTSEVYGKGIKFPFREDDDVLLGTTDKTRWAYAASKMVDEYLGYAYAREFGLEVVIFRLFNTVGPRQTGEYGMVIPRFARQAIRNEPITVYGDGTQTRSFCDVRDVIRAIESLAQCPEAVGKLFNVGGSQEISMLDLAKRVRQLAGSSSEITLIPYEQAFAKGFEDMQRRIPSTDKIREILGWESVIPLDDTLRAVIESET